MIRRLFLALATAAAVTCAPASADDTFIIVQSTTSTQNSGLFDAILPIFEDKTGIQVRVVAVGTGQAIRNAMNGDGDVLFVHDTAAEEDFVAAGHGLSRADVMYNDFVVVGPADDPADIDGMTSVVAAMADIASSQSIWVSRGDDSGTHKAEMRLWAGTKAPFSSASRQWYRETGQGMGATLNIGIGMRGYVLTDRATWIAFGNKQNHRILVEGDPNLFNQYGIILVNPSRHAGIRAAAGQAFVDWILSPEGQDAIAAYKVNGQQLFFPNAGD